MIAKGRNKAITFRHICNIADDHNKDVLFETSKQAFTPSRQYWISSNSNSSEAIINSVVSNNLPHSHTPPLDLPQKFEIKWPFSIEPDSVTFKPYDNFGIQWWNAGATEECKKSALQFKMCSCDYSNNLYAKVM